MTGMLSATFMVDATKKAVTAIVGLRGHPWAACGYVEGSTSRRTMAARKGTHSSTGGD
jgi:hypothetical protein